MYFGKARTINDYDHNETRSLPFFWLMRNGNVMTDIIWGGGSVHDSYDLEVGRTIGTVNEQENGNKLINNLQWYYSNGPTELWNGTLKKLDNRRYHGKGKYSWRGWGNQSSGTFEIALMLLKPATLTCGHEFCLFCIRAIRYTHEDNAIIWPLCRQESGAVKVD